MFTGTGADLATWPFARRVQQDGRIIGQVSREKLNHRHEGVLNKETLTGYVIAKGEILERVSGR